VNLRIATRNAAAAFLLGLAARQTVAAAAPAPTPTTPAMNAVEKQITRDRQGHLLTNIGVWSPDSSWITYDTRSDAAGEKFDADSIEIVQVQTGEVKRLYGARSAAHCGAPTFHPREHKVIFILGPEHPTPDWQYGPFHRQGVIVAVDNPGVAVPLDARDLTPPFTPGALRGGSHVHVWDPEGQLVSFTYEDHVLAQFAHETAEHEINLRNIGVSVPNRPVKVDQNHPRNHDGTCFSVLVTRTTAQPEPGSDEIRKAFEEGWVGTNGYVRSDGTRQHHALAFQGWVVTSAGETISEVFLVDLPQDLTAEGDEPLAGTATRRPAPPRGTRQRRLTHTADRKFPGLQGPRHWLRSSPDGSQIACLMKDDAGVVQLWTVPPNGGSPTQLTHNASPIGSAFSWSPDGRLIAHVMDRSVCVTEVETGHTLRLTKPSDEISAPRPEACVFSPDGKKIAYVRRALDGADRFNQVFTLTLTP
jgi:hypothetical protein